MKLSDVEKQQLKKLDRGCFTMDEWKDFSANAILAHVVYSTSVEEVDYLMSLQEEK